MINKYFLPFCRLLFFFFTADHALWASLIAQLVKNLPAVQRTRFDSWVRKIPWRRDRLSTPAFLGFPCDSAGTESTYNVGDLGSIPGLGRCRGEDKGYPLQICSEMYFHIILIFCTLWKSKVLLLLLSL